MTLEPKSETGISLEILSEKGIVPLTAFTNFIATHTSSDKERITAQVHEHLGISGKGMVAEVSKFFVFTIFHVQKALQEAFL